MALDGALGYVQAGPIFVAQAVGDQPCDLLFSLAEGQPDRGVAAVTGAGPDLSVEPGGAERPIADSVAWASRGPRSTLTLAPTSTRTLSLAPSSRAAPDAAAWQPRAPSK